MTLNYTLDAEDIKQMLSELMATKPYRNGRWIITIFAVAIFAGIGIFFPKYPLVGKELFIFVYCMFFALLSLIILPRLLKKLTVKKSLKKFLVPENQLAFGSRELTLDENGFGLRTDQVEEKLKWSAIIKVEETAYFYKIFVSALAFHSVPKSKITPDEAQELEAILSSYVECVPQNFKKSKN